MAQQNEREYLERRRQVSEANARAAADPGIARIHGQLAEHYAKRLQQQGSLAAE